MAIPATAGVVGDAGRAAECFVEVAGAADAGRSGQGTAVDAGGAVAAAVAAAEDVEALGADGMAAAAVPAFQVPAALVEAGVARGLGGPTYDGPTDVVEALLAGATGATVKLGAALVRDIPAALGRTRCDRRRAAFNGPVADLGAAGAADPAASSPADTAGAAPGDYIGAGAAGKAVGVGVARIAFAAVARLTGPGRADAGVALVVGGAAGRAVRQLADAAAANLAGPRAGGVAGARVGAGEALSRVAGAAAQRAAAAVGGGPAGLPCRTTGRWGTALPAVADLTGNAFAVDGAATAVGNSPALAGLAHGRGAAALVGVRVRATAARLGRQTGVRAAQRAAAAVGDGAAGRTGGGTARLGAAADIDGAAAATGLIPAALAALERAAAAVGDLATVLALSGAGGSGAAEADRVLDLAGGATDAAAAVGRDRVGRRHARARAALDSLLTFLPGSLARVGSGPIPSREGEQAAGRRAREGADHGAAGARGREGTG